MDLSLLPRQAGEYVTRLAKDVSINDDAVKKLASVLADAVQCGKVGYQAYKDKSNFPVELQLSLPELLNWTFLIDALNFNFWTPDGQPKFTVTYNKTTRVGYLAMVDAVNRAIAEGKPMHDPTFYGKLMLKDVQHIFRSDTKSLMPLFDERVRILAEVSAKLLEKYDGKFERVLEEAGRDALSLVQVVVREFPCFRDEAEYEGQRVALYKRAQILAADVDLILAVQGLPGLSNVDQLTMFADYRVPQVLLHYGVLSYSSQLMTKLRKEHLFENGSPEEVEVRACSIEAVERTVLQCRSELVSRGMDADGAAASVISVWVDYFLWEYRVQNARALSSVPYHRTRCIYY